MSTDSLSRWRTRSSSKTAIISWLTGSTGPSRIRKSITLRHCFLPACGIFPDCTLSKKPPLPRCPRIGHYHGSDGWEGEILMRGFRHRKAELCKRLQYPGSSVRRIRNCTEGLWLVFLDIETPQ